jgi:HAD superfamily hydrolase (TIGR01509 family)
MSTARHHRYRAILWDNDGVLVDTERWYFDACREALAPAGIELTEAMYLQHWLASAGGILELATGHGLSAERIAALQRDRDLRYERHLREQHLPIAGVQETLAALRPHFAMGIVTSSHRDHFTAIHRRTGFLAFFDFVLACGDYARSKPHPDPYLAGIARTGFRPEECLAIEDTPRGLAAARAAGLDCWVIPTHLSVGADFTSATRVLGTVRDVASLLLNPAEPTPA